MFSHGVDERVTKTETSPDDYRSYSTVRRKTSVLPIGTQGWEPHKIMSPTVVGESGGRPDTPSPVLNKLSVCGRLNQIKQNPLES